MERPQAHGRREVPGKDDESPVWLAYCQRSAAEPPLLPAEETLERSAIQLSMNELVELGERPVGIKRDAEDARDLMRFLQRDGALP